MFGNGCVSNTKKTLRCWFLNRSYLVTRNRRSCIDPLGHSSALSGIRSSSGIQAVRRGFRSSYRDWAAECTNAPHEAMEAALAHTMKNKVEARYARSDLLDRRPKLMNGCTTYLESGT